MPSCTVVCGTRIGKFLRNDEYWSGGRSALAHSAFRRRVVIATEQVRPEKEKVL